MHGGASGEMAAILDRSSMPCHAVCGIRRGHGHGDTLRPRTSVGARKTGAHFLGGKGLEVRYEVPIDSGA